jgi:hypothetical protein
VLIDRPDGWYAAPPALPDERMMTSPEPPEVARDFWSAAYAAISP